MGKPCIIMLFKSPPTFKTYFKVCMCLPTIQHIFHVCIHSYLWQKQQCRRCDYSQSSRRISLWSCSPSTTWWNIINTIIRLRLKSWGGGLGTCGNLTPAVRWLTVCGQCGRQRNQTEPTRVQCVRAPGDIRNGAYSFRQMRVTVGA